eukprot:scaffold544_cov256-Pinguiococcus_pyrenoidosus.AAC.8
MAGPDESDFLVSLLNRSLGDSSESPEERRRAAESDSSPPKSDSRGESSKKSRGRRPPASLRKPRRRPRPRSQSRSKPRLPLSRRREPLEQGLVRHVRRANGETMPPAVPPWPARAPGAPGAQERTEGGELRLRAMGLRLQGQLQTIHALEARNHELRALAALGSSDGDQPQSRSLSAIVATHRKTEDGLRKRIAELEDALQVPQTTLMSPLAPPKR